VKRSLFALGLATCVLPLFVAVAVGMWSPWAGLLAGATVAIGFGVWWSRRAGRVSYLLGIAAGMALAVVGASLLLPSLRMLTGSLPTYRLGTAYQPAEGTPMSLEMLAIEGGAPRVDLLYVGDVFETRNDSGTENIYSVVSPVVPPEWERTSAVPAWAICEVSRDTTGQSESAREECAGLFGRRRSMYEREGFDADLPNGPMVEEAMAEHGLTQDEAAPIFVLRTTDEAWRGVVIPLILALLCLGGVRAATNEHGSTEPGERDG
jgi:hypothetical protein